MRRNRLREILNNGESSVSTHIHSTWPSVIELAGYSGVFDYVEFVGEYAPYDLYALENLGRAIDLFDNMSGMMKIEQEPRMYLTIRAIGSGIQNLLFADVRTVADAEACVKAVKAESPATGGLHGVGLRRDVYGAVFEGGTPAWVQSLEESVIMLMIEKRQAVEDLEDILSVKGIDMVQFGPADYSMSLGLTGHRDHPSVLEAEKYVIETALARGIQPRAEINDPEQAKKYLDMGVRHFCIGTDVTILFNWFKETGGALRSLIDSA